MKIIPLYIAILLLAVSVTAYDPQGQRLGRGRSSDYRYDNYNYMDDIDQETLMAIGIICILIYGLSHLPCLWRCLSLRKNRQKIKDEMKLKRMDYERMMGIQPNQRFFNELKTVHI